MVICKASHLYSSFESWDGGCKIQGPERLELPGLQHSVPVLGESRFSAAPLRRIKYQKAPKRPGRLEKGRNVDVFVFVSFEFLRLPFVLLKPWFPCSSMLLDAKTLMLDLEFLTNHLARCCSMPLDSARFCSMLLDSARCSSILLDSARAARCCFLLVLLART